MTKAAEVVVDPDGRCDLRAALIPKIISLIYMLENSNSFQYVQSMNICNSMRSNEFELVP